MCAHQETKSLENTGALKAALVQYVKLTCRKKDKNIEKYKNPAARHSKVFRREN